MPPPRLVILLVAGASNFVMILSISSIKFKFKFKFKLSKRPVGMKNTGPLYLSVINRPQSPDVWYTKIRMGQNTIGNIMRSMASCLKTNKKLTNHSMRKTLVGMMGFNPGFLPAGCSGFPPSFPSQFEYRMAAFTSSGSPVPSQSYTGCTFNFYSKDVNEKSEPQKKRRAYIIESDDED